MTDCHVQASHHVSAFVLVFNLVFTGSTVWAADPSADNEHVFNTPGKDMTEIREGRFATLYEPSGIAPLPEGRFLIVEDEPERALRLVTADLSIENELTLNNETHLGLPADLTAQSSLGVLDDLEAVAHDRMQRFYVVSSHDDSAPHWISKRQKILRFSIRGERMQDVVMRHTLLRDLLASYPQLINSAQGKRKRKSAVVNIEAMAFDGSRDVLLIGLRAPVLNGKAIIIRLMNPDDYLDGVAPLELGEELWTVDLDKGGLRAMAFDERSNQLLLVSRRENHKNDSYKLWRLSASATEPAVRIELGEQEDMLDSVEGLVPVSLGSSLDPGVLFVRDNGNAKKSRGASWFFLTRKQLGLGDELP